MIQHNEKKKKIVNTKRKDKQKLRLWIKNLVVITCICRNRFLFQSTAAVVSLVMTYQVQDSSDDVELGHFPVVVLLTLNSLDHHLQHSTFKLITTNYDAKKIEFKFVKFLTHVTCIAVQLSCRTILFVEIICR